MECEEIEQIKHSNLEVFDYFTSSLRVTTCEVHHIRYGCVPTTFSN